MLCLEIDFGMGDGLHEDTAYLEAEPSWEVNFYSLKIPADSLEPGFCLEQPNPVSYTHLTTDWKHG